MTICIRLKLGWIILILVALPSWRNKPTLHCKARIFSESVWRCFMMLLTIEGVFIFVDPGYMQRHPAPPHGYHNHNNNRMPPGPPPPNFFAGGFVSPNISCQCLEWHGLLLLLYFLDLMFLLFTKMVLAPVDTKALWRPFWKIIVGNIVQKIQQE